jgi:hypothetical protein
MAELVTSTPAFTPAEMQLLLATLGGACAPCADACPFVWRCSPAFARAGENPFAGGLLSDDLASPVRRSPRVVGSRR